MECSLVELQVLTKLLHHEIQAIRRKYIHITNIFLLIKNYIKLYHEYHEIIIINKRLVY